MSEEVVRNTFFSGDIAMKYQFIQVSTFQICKFSFSKLAKKASRSFTTGGQSSTILAITASSTDGYGCLGVVE